MGTLLPVIAGIAHRFGLVELARMQLVRTILWVTLLLLLAIAGSLPRIARRQPAAAIAGSAGFAFYLVGSLWFFPLSALCVALRLSGFQIGGPARVAVIGSLGFAGLFAPASLESLGDGTAATIGASAIASNWGPSAVLAGAAPLAVVPWRAHRAWHLARQRHSPVWLEVAAWIRSNVGPDQCLVGPTRDLSFRALTLRTSVSEPASALAWVDPQQYLELESRVARIAATAVSGSTDLQALAPATRDLGCRFAVVEGPTTRELSPWRVRLQVDPFTVLELPGDRR